jgi:LPP20 lipoprotein
MKAMAMQGSRVLSHGSVVRKLGGAVLLMSMLLLSACITMKSSPKSAEVPAWMVSPPADTDDAMYGVGEGLDVGTATRLALRDVASKLRVSVSGSVRSQVSEANGRVDSSASSSLMSEIQKTEFRQYTLMQSAPAPSGVYALVKVDRQAFLADTRDRIQRMNLLTSQLLAGQGGNALERYIALQRARPLLAAQQGLYMLFKPQDLSREDTARQNELQQRLADADAAASRLVLSVQSAPADADVKGVISALLTEQGLKLTDQASASQGIVEVVVGQQDSQFGKDAMTKLSSKLSLKSARGTVLSAKEHLVTGASRTDAKSARQQAVMKLQQELRASGLLGAFGIQPVSVQTSQR